MCRGALQWMSVAARCVSCSSSYPVDDGIPIFVRDSSPAAGEADEGDDYKLRQVAFHDRAGGDCGDCSEHDASEFEIEKPRRGPRLYHWIYADKLRRSVSGLRSMLSGTTALTVCGGSGMDAEFLARSGCRVISSDISLGAARRTQERARRYDLPVAPVVADAERLPFTDRSIDLVYVHDGLHHLEDPLVGLAEMARVARVAISVNEPARAVATALAVRLGLSAEYEEAGNRVGRMDPGQIVALLESEGFRIVKLDRYASYYKYGSILRWLSNPVVFPAVTAAASSFNAVAGGIGNKLSVQAVRSG